MEPREIIREARERRDWAQKDLADRAGVSQVAIVKIESGATVQSKFLPKIAQLLGLDLADLDPSLKGVTLPAGSPVFSNPVIANNVLWDNRAGSWTPKGVVGIGGAGDAALSEGSPRDLRASREGHRSYLRGGAKRRDRQSRRIDVYVVLHSRARDRLGFSLEVGHCGVRTILPGNA